MTPRVAEPQPRQRRRLGSRLLRWLVAWIRLMRRRSAVVLAIAVLAMLLSGGYAAMNVSINTSTTDMLAEDLPFQQQFIALDEAFPQDYRTIVVVIDGDTPERVSAAADTLAQRLKGHEDLVQNVFHPEGDPFFRRHGFLYLSLADLEALGASLAGAQPMLAALAEDPSLRGLSRVMTLALDNIEQAAGPDGQLPPQFEAALDGLATSVAAVQQGQAQPFSWRGALAPPDDPLMSGRRQLLLLEPVFDFSSLQPAEDAIALIRHTVAELQLTPENGVRVRLTGEPVMMEDELKTVEESIGFANLLSLAVVIGLLVLGFRSGRLVEATTFSLLVGLSLTACFAVVAVGAFNLISVAFAVLFIGFGVDFGIHFCMRAKEHIDAEIGPGLALEEAGAGVAPGLALTTICASIGFLAFTPTAYQGLVELGIISSAGMVIALITSLSLIPAYLAARPPGRSDVRQRRVTGQLLERALRRRARPILWTALALGLAAAATLPFVRFDDLPLNLRDPETESVSTLYDMLEDPRFDPFRAAVLAQDAAQAERIAARLRALPEVERVETAQDLVPDRQDEKLALLGDLALMMTPVLTPPASGAQPAAPDAEELRAALAALREAAAAAAPRSPAARRLAGALEAFEPTDANVLALQGALLANLPPLLDELREALDAGPVSLEDVPALLLKRRQTADGRVLVEAFPREDLRDEQARRRFAEAVQSAAPGASGEAIAVTEAGKAVVTSFYQAGAATFAMISVLLLTMLRNVRDSLMVMAPLVLAGLLTVATTVLINRPFNFANVIVLPLLFGLGVSSGINMMIRGRQQGVRSLLVTSTPRAVLFSALTTIGSFGSLALSKHPGMAGMGLLLAIALTLTTLCTLIVLPALRNVFIPSPGRRVRSGPGLSG